MILAFENCCLLRKLVIGQRTTSRGGAASTAEAGLRGDFVPQPQTCPSAIRQCCDSTAIFCSVVEQRGEKKRKIQAQEKNNRRKRESQDKRKRRNREETEKKQRRNREETEKKQKIIREVEYHDLLLTRCLMELIVKKST